MTTNKLKIGISLGDINGIGLEVVLKTLADKRILNWCTPVLYGSTKVASYHKNIIKVKDLSLHNAKDINSINPNAVNIINCWLENVKIALGKCTLEGGKYASFSLAQAVEDLKQGHIDALVTAPINKKAMQLSGFEYPGHTEYLTAKFGVKESLMLMVHEDLRIGLVTNHLPVSQVATTITKELVYEKIMLMDQTLKMDFGIDRPAIALLGLNPHAGDDGVLGSEEQEILLPAIEAAKAKKVLVIGPYSADGFFGSGNYANFDGILAMYHDQGLVPFKTLAFGGGINFTAGLPVIRTSPDHGTAFDIAGKNQADPSSFRQALYLAIDSAKQRLDYKEMTKNPLQKIEFKDFDKNEGNSQGKRSNSKKKEGPAKKQTQAKAEKEASQQEKQPTKKVEKKQLTIEEKLALAAEKKAKEQAETDKSVPAKEEKSPIVEMAEALVMDEDAAPITEDVKKEIEATVTEPLVEKIEILEEKTTKEDSTEETTIETTETPADLTTEAIIKEDNA